ncbi:tyrosine-type recombinase/integrase [Jannaschia seohaensis]|uniref:Site-specific recombinase XerC n=1 Tax=Jannaschia seohaensis TaxID=475081 RepID=A0A2Y9A9Y2_9RHOB|nr:tyrosine-type recombinase/integrase [Jannaschia seohaensis]PWJ20931.1 site-specific recombinase XerC [Jannaschia seohaensis]SSA41341.1 Site-specific recombinase XerC [Jannaschia seohaensis]
MLRRELDTVRETRGTATLRAVRPRHVRADVIGAGNPGSRLKAWRYLCAFAIASGGIDEDPAIAVRLPRDPGRQKATIGHKRWPREAIEAYRARHRIGTVKRAAMALLLWTGGRIGDAVEMGRQHVPRDGVLDYSQSKTGGPGYVPWTSPLPNWALAWEADRDAMHQALSALGTGRLTFLETQTGRVRSSKALGNLIREACDEAGWADLTGHGARKTRACDLIDSGATPHQAAAWTGHEDLKTLIHYARQADRRGLVMGREREQNVGNRERSDGGNGS